MIKVLGVFDYACETGFGTVAKNIVKELKKHFRDELKLDIIANNYFGESYNEDDNTFVSSAKFNDVKGDDFGRHFFLDVLKQSNEYDILFIINDLGMVVPIIEILEAIKKEKKEKNMKSFKSMFYFPMDCAGFYEILKGLEFFDILVTYTEYGRKEVLKVRPELSKKLKVIYHGTNTNDFKPLPQEKVLKFKNDFFLDNADKFIITNLNRNQPRKDIPNTIMAFREAKANWQKGFPEPFLYLHMHPLDPMGWDLRAIFWQLDLVEGKDYKLLPTNWVDNMPPPEAVNLIYNASDVFLSTTLAEGWGLSVTEAMAARLPVICPENTSLAEITNYGERAFTYISDYPVVNTSDMIVRYQGSYIDIAEKILQVAEMKLLHSSREKLKKNLDDKIDRAYNWATKNTWTEVCKRWIEYFKELS